MSALIVEEYGDVLEQATDQGREVVPVVGRLLASHNLILGTTTRVPASGSFNDNTRYLVITAIDDTARYTLGGSSVTASATAGAVVPSGQSRGISIQAEHTHLAAVVYAES